MTRTEIPTCVICDDLLTVHDRVRGDTCDKADCRNRALRQRLQTSAQQRQRSIELAEQLQREMLAARHKDGAESAPVVMLPANERALGNLPEKRKRRFRDYLTRSLSEAAARRFSRAGREAANPHEESENQFPVVHDPDTLRVFGNACAACRGKCCSQGEEHAFLRPEMVRRFMERNPKMRPREVLQAYLDHLPRVAYRGSCVYHTREGCNLPQPMRSRTCNEYLCDGLQEIDAVARETGAARVFAAAANWWDVVRVAALDVDGRDELELTVTEAALTETAPRGTLQTSGEPSE